MIAVISAAMWYPPLATLMLSFGIGLFLEIYDTSELELTYGLIDLKRVLAWNETIVLFTDLVNETVTLKKLELIDLSDGLAQLSPKTRYDICSVRSEVQAFCETLNAMPPEVLEKVSYVSYLYDFFIKGPYSAVESAYHQGLAVSGSRVGGFCAATMVVLSYLAYSRKTYGTLHEFAKSMFYTSNPHDPADEVFLEQLRRDVDDRD